MNNNVSSSKELKDITRYRHFLPLKVSSSKELKDKKSASYNNICGHVFHPQRNWKYKSAISFI